MNRDFVVDVIVEIERHSNEKWEYDRKNDSLFLDRVLPEPYFYPQAYGFFPDTLGKDGDELDILLITDKTYKNYNSDKQTTRGYIVGGIMMHDEKGEDAKIFVVPENEIVSYLNKSEVEKTEIYDEIIRFFSNYKSKDSDKWSRVDSVLSYLDAVELYKQSKKDFLGKQI